MAVDFFHSLKLAGVFVLPIQSRGSSIWVAPARKGMSVQSAKLDAVPVRLPPEKLCCSVTGAIPCTNSLTALVAPEITLGFLPVSAETLAKAPPPPGLLGFPIIRTAI